MSLTNRLSKKDEAPRKRQEYNQTDASAAEDTHMSEQILARNSRPNHPMRRATDLTQRGNVFATMAGSGPPPDDEVRSDHVLASSLPVEQTAIDADRDNCDHVGVLGADRYHCPAVGYSKGIRSDHIGVRGATRDIGDDASSCLPHRQPESPLVLPSRFP